MPDVADVLRSLLAAEQRSLVPRLVEATVFVSRPGVDDYAALQSFASDYRTCCRMLTELLLSLGASPGPRTGDLQSADIHFQEVTYAMRRLETDLAALVERYAHASSQLAGNRQALKVVGEILERHREQLATVRGLIAADAGQPAAR